LCHQPARAVLPLMVPSGEDPIGRVDDVLVPKRTAWARVPEDGIVAPSAQLGFGHVMFATPVHELRPPEVHLRRNDEAGVRVRADGFSDRGLGRGGEVNAAATPPRMAGLETLAQDDVANVGAGLVVQDPRDRLWWPKRCAGSTTYPCQVPLLLLHLTVASPHPDLATVDARVPLLCAKAEA